MSHKLRFLRKLKGCTVIDLISIEDMDQKLCLYKINFGVQWGFKNNIWLSQRIPLMVYNYRPWRRKDVEHPRKKLELNKGRLIHPQNKKEEEEDNIGMKRDKSSGFSAQSLKSHLN